MDTERGKHTCIQVREVKDPFPCLIKVVIFYIPGRAQHTGETSSMARFLQYGNKRGLSLSEETEEDSASQAGKAAAAIFKKKV